MISANFSRQEFACKCGCGFSAVDIELVQLLETVRRKFNAPITINSACRCGSHNKSVGGSKDSKHKLGIAADIAVKGIDPSDVYDFLCSQDKYGVGKYNSFTHIDVRNNKARW